MMEEKKIVYKLEKHELASERKERKERNLKRLLFVAICILCIWVGFSLGYLFNRAGGAEPQDITANQKMEQIKGYMESFWLYANDYEDLDETLSDKAFYGMTSFDFDPYTTYMSAEELDEFSSGINLNVVGIGISYAKYAGVPTVLRVFKDAPAEKAGIQEGDQLIKVDGVDVIDKTTDEIREMVLGEEGTNVTITIRREGEEMDLDITRAEVDVTVFAEAVDDVVVLSIYSFGDHSFEEVRHYLDAYPDYEKLIIDLRDNGGGYQTAVEDIASLFLKEGSVVMKLIYGDGSENISRTSGDVCYDNFKKIIILTNGNTASASEVLTLALREQHPNATIMGTTTYGKGVVQTTVSIRDGSALKITTSKWLSSKDVWINGEGIEPDVEVRQDDVIYMNYDEFPEGKEFDADQVDHVIKVAEAGLKYLDYEVERTDGYFPESLKATIAQYQQEHDLEVTSTLNAETYEAIISGIVREWNFNKDKDYQMNAALEAMREQP